MRPKAGETRARSVRRLPTVHRKYSKASQAHPEPLGRAQGYLGQGNPVPPLADYCEPYHCDPPRKNPTEPLLRGLHREVLLGTW